MDRVSTIRRTVEIIPDKRKLVLLVEQANDGRLCLPDFQRDFVWTREQVADLLRSVLRGYFIGTLLLLRSNPQQPPFAPVFVRGSSPVHRNPHPELLALDGQQRLSSLLYALTAPKLALKDTSHRRWFFIDLAKMTDDLDDDSLVFDRAPRELDGLDKPEQQYSKRVLPLTCLLRPGDFLKWRDGLEDWLRENDAQGLAEFRSSWRESLSALAAGFQTFEIPLVELPAVDERDPQSIGRVCAIFEKLNSTGTDLSVYDLMTARLYRSGVRLHDLWDRAVTDNPRLARWSKGKADTNKFGVLLLRILALRRDLDVKPSVLIDLDATNFEQDFKRAAAAMERALEMIELVNADGFGVFDAKWLPGFGVLPVLAAMRAELEDRKLGEIQRSELRRWYWMNVFLERYSSAVESKSRKDFAEMKRHWIDGGPLPEVFQDAQARIGSPGFSVRGSATGASSVYRGTFCLLALKGARDWRLGETIQLQQLQDHHVFPQAYLKRHGIAQRVRINSVLNRTLISDQTNNMIKDKAPAEYIADPKIFMSDPAPLLEDHFIAAGAAGAMHSAGEPIGRVAIEGAYEDFLKAREDTLIEQIRQLCGVSSLSAIEAEQASAEAADQEMESEVAGSAAKASSSVKAMQFEFWSEFRRYCEDRGSSLRFRKPGHQHWYNFSIGRSGFVISLTVNTRENELACKLYMHDDDAREAFAELAAQREAIEAAIGEVGWDDVPDRQRCQIVQRREGDLARRDRWPDYFAWFKDRAEVFQRELGPRVRSLGIEVDEEDVA